MAIFSSKARYAAGRPALPRGGGAMLAVAIAMAFIALMPVRAIAANQDALWNIVNGQCAPNMAAHGDPAPCRLLDRQRGFAMLKDIVGEGQFLLIPTQRLTGIESPELLQPDAPNYWAYAWEQRYRVGAAVGRKLARDQIGLEINSAAARSQLQLHIHIDCIRPDLPQLLRAHRADPPGQWLPLMLDGHEYRIMRLTGRSLGDNNPFKLAAAMDPFAATAMAAQSLLLTGAYFQDGVDGNVREGIGPHAENKERSAEGNTDKNPQKNAAKNNDGNEGFYLINAPVNFAQGERGNAEVWLDHGCAR